MISVGKEERELIHHQFSVDRLLEAMKRKGRLTMGETALVMMEKGLISPMAAGQLMAGEA